MLLYYTIPYYTVRSYTILYYTTRGLRQQHRQGRDGKRKEMGGKFGVVAFRSQGEERWEEKRVSGARCARKDNRWWEYRVSGGGAPGKTKFIKKKIKKKRLGFFFSHLEFFQFLTQCENTSLFFFSIFFLISL
jgi:hypothetical protein